jgi:glycosyltransferase involved in cell wall biosynthesis
LKILIVSWYFPPVNTIGALRVGKFARFLLERGHDVGVVAGRNWGHPETLPLGVPLERVVYAKSTDVNALPNQVAQRLKSRFSRSIMAPPELMSNAGPSRSEATIKSVARHASDLYHHLINVPDKSIGWLPWAYAAASRMCRTWQPDLVFGSAPPFTGLLVCRLLSARLGLPWVAELRDRWADDPYNEPPPWRVAVDQWLERKVLETAKGLVTVTEPWAELYRQKYHKPTVTVYNGYDPRDFDDAEPSSGSPDRTRLLIGYTGGIYPGKRDPRPLFAALRMLGEAGERFRVVFQGTDPTHVLPLAERAGVMRLVEVRSGVPYKQSLELQRRSDVLLLMQWNDPRDQGHCPAKLFEYLASRRPVLLLGLEDGVPATMLRQRSAGLCANDPAVIAAQLSRWLAEKDQFGIVRPLPPSACEGLSRATQFEKLENFLLESLHGGRYEPSSRAVLS